MREIVIHTELDALLALVDAVAVAAAHVGIWREVMVAHVGTEHVRLLRAHPRRAVPHEVEHPAAAVAVLAMLVALRVNRTERGLRQDFVVKARRAHIERLAVVGGRGVAVGTQIIGEFFAEHAVIGNCVDGFLRGLVAAEHIREITLGVVRARTAVAQHLCLLFLTQQVAMQGETWLPVCRGIAHDLIALMRTHVIIPWLCELAPPTTCGVIIACPRANGQITVAAIDQATEHVPDVLL